jgi:cobalt-zinc-cadmium efflux system outer membrane protein
MRPLLGAAFLALAGTCHGATLPGLLDEAWARQPHAQTLEARRAEIDARRRAADHPFAGPPVLGLANRNDRLGRDRGQWENEIEIAAPLWLPGQQTARRQLAAAESDEGEAAGREARLQLAGELRSLVWQAIAARDEALAQAERARAARALAADVERRVRAGDLARTDLLAAETEAMGAEAAAADAAARREQALERLRRLTGRDALPEPSLEQAREPADAHPRLVAALQSLRRAESRLRMVAGTTRDNPEVGVQLRRERDAYGQDARDSVRFAIRIPLATEDRNNPLLTAATTEVVAAAGTHRQVALTIESEARAAVLALDNAEQQVTLAQRRQALAAERLQLLRRAFDLGELGLPELLRAQVAARESDLELVRLRAERGHAIARLNQARGVLP